MYKKKELQLSYFSICEGKKLDDKIVTYFALKAGSTVSVINCLLHTLPTQLYTIPTLPSSISTISMMVVKTTLFNTRALCSEVVCDMG